MATSAISCLLWRLRSNQRADFAKSKAAIWNQYQSQKCTLRVFTITSSR
ncbi:unnamed protein product [Strongylus vulgaris]|uniref:Uncharacterized protein n=1 Tax=Strongylus vulgaris TaxID=40348 RepID=A0A3P7J0H3_STRVU|nr:unnamed protein product [Strongylus vulgaris]